MAACGLAYAQPAAPQPTVGDPKKLAPADPKKKKDKDEVRINHADRARYDSRRGLFYLFGNVEFQDEDMKLFCDEASYDQEKDAAACAGNLKIVDKETTITGKLINADFEAEIVNIEGSVVIVTTKTLKSKEENKEKPATTTITCDKIVYTYTKGKRLAVATGHLKAVHKDTTVTAPIAEYDLEKDIISLGDEATIKMSRESAEFKAKAKKENKEQFHVYVTMKNGSRYRNLRTTISVTEDWIDMDPFMGVLVIEEKEEEKPAPETPQPAETPAPPAETKPPGESGPG